MDLRDPRCIASLRRSTTLMTAECTRLTAARQYPVRPTLISQLRCLRFPRFLTTSDCQRTACVAKRETAHKLDGHGLVVEQVGACARNASEQRGREPVEAASLRGNCGRSVLTFKNDTEGALADLLAYAIVHADDVGGGGRGVGVRSHGRTAGLTVRRCRRRKREGQRPDCRGLGCIPVAYYRSRHSPAVPPGGWIHSHRRCAHSPPHLTEIHSSSAHEDMRQSGWITGMMRHVAD